MAKKKSKKRQRSEEKPDVYSVDIGNQGVKKKQNNNGSIYSTNNSSSSSKAAIAVGSLPLTQEELKRRKERMVRRFGDSNLLLTFP